MKIGKLDAQLLRKNISNRIAEDIRQQRVGCAAVAILQHGEMIYEETFGTQILGQPEPLRKDAVFRIASMTKPVTAVAVLLQAQRGLLNLDDLVSKYLPEYAHLSLAYMDDNGREVSCGDCRKPLQIRHLMTHTSGMEADALYRKHFHEIPKENLKTLAAAVKYYAGIPLPYEPGSLRRYSGKAAFDVLARIVEVTSGMDFGAYLQQEIFIPCKMVDTTFAPTQAQWERVVSMHDRQNDVSVIAETTPRCVVDAIPVTHTLGGSGLVSTMSDYVKFAQMLQNKGFVDGKQLLRPELLEEMASAQLPEELMSETVNQGLGVRVITGDTYPWLPVGSFGWSGAYGTHFWVDPVNGITAVYMKNSRYDGGSGAITAKHFEEDVFLALADN